MDEKKTLDLNVEELEERIAPAHISLPAGPPLDAGEAPDSAPRGNVTDAPPNLPVTPHGP